MMAKTASPFVLTTLLLTSACAQEPLGLALGEDLQIQLHVTGGFAATDFQVFLSGTTGTLVGVACTSLCGFEEGEVLAELTRDQVAYLGGLFRDAQVHALDGTDFGVQCCDQFHYDLQFGDRQGESRVQGSSEALPQELRMAVAALHGVASGVLPVVVDFDTPRQGWPQDPLDISGPEISGDILHVGISYGGGCREHEIQAVAWSGWMESNPVQVRVILAHEDHDDPCDAVVTRSLAFDLGSLKRTYQQSYGINPAGATTLRVLVEDPRLASPLGAWVLDYVF